MGLAKNLNLGTRIKNTLNQEGDFIKFFILGENSKIRELITKWLKEWLLKVIRGI